MRPTLDSYALEIPTILNSNIWRRHISSSDVWIVVTCLLQMWQSTHLKKTWTIHTSEEVMNNSHIWRSHVTRHATNMSHVTHMYLKSMGPTRNSDAHPWSTYNSHIWRSHVTRHVTYLRHITYTSCHTSCHIFETCHIHVMSHVMSHIWDISHTLFTYTYLKTMGPTRNSDAHPRNTRQFPHFLNQNWASGTLSTPPLPTAQHVQRSTSRTPA